MGPKSTHDSSKGLSNFSLSESNENSCNNSNSREIYAKLIDRIWSQDEKIGGLEAYRALCEQKLREVDPGLKLPLREDSQVRVVSSEKVVGDLKAEIAELTRKLQIKEQDLFYSN